MAARWQTSDWLTAHELAELRLAGLPGSKFRINEWAKRHGWRTSGKARRRAGAGGGWEYHISLLPQAALDDLLARRLAASAAADGIHLPETDRPELLRAQARARLVWTAEAAMLGQGREASLAHFCRLYNAGKVPVSDIVRQLIPSISPATLRRWRRHLHNGDFSRLSGAARRRRGRSPIDRAADGALATYVAALVIARPQLSATQIRDLAIAEFGEVIDVAGRQRPMPSVRAFQRWLDAFRKDNAAGIARATNPDLYRSKYRHAGGSRDGWVKAVNDLWEIDASPADVMTTEGRVSVYVCVDAYSRQMMVHVSKTPRTQAMLELVIRCMLEWGTPRVIRSDNGSDFTSHQARACFKALEIEHEICPPFSPEKKGKVERAIRTLMHGLMSLLPGYVGHNVAERKVIEARKAFSQRLGQQQDNLLQVDMTPAELQEAIDRWVADVYHHRPHRGLGGRTPHVVAATCTAPRRKVESRQTLVMLAGPLAEGNGLRTVGREGVRVGGHTYITRRVAAGTQVLVRHDLTDMGRVWLFDPATQAFLDEAICPELAGIDPQQAHAAARKLRDDLVGQAIADARATALRIARDPRKLVNDITRAAADRNGDIIAFPPRQQPHTTTAIETATAATTGQQPPSQVPADIRQRIDEELLAEWQAQRAGNVAPLPPAQDRQQEPDDIARFKRALAIERAIDQGQPVSDEDRRWLQGYQHTSEYRAQKRLAADFPQLYGLAG